MLYIKRKPKVCKIISINLCAERKQNSFIQKIIEKVPTCQNHE